MCKWNENNTSFYLLVSHDGNSSSALYQLLIALINVYLFSVCSFPLSPSDYYWQEFVLCDRKQNRTIKCVWGRERERERPGETEQANHTIHFKIWYLIFFCLLNLLVVVVIVVSKLYFYRVKVIKITFFLEALNIPHNLYRLMLHTFVTILLVQCESTWTECQMVWGKRIVRL